MHDDQRPPYLLLFLFACIVAVMLFSATVTAPPTSYYVDTCVALVGCNETPRVQP